MKKMIFLLLALLLLPALALPAHAAQLRLDQYATFSDMGQSWYQGYSPVTANNVMSICLPLRWDDCVGKAKVSIALDDANVFLLAAQPRAVNVTPRDGLYRARLLLYLQPGRRNGDFPATITFTGVNDSGEEISAQLPYTIRVRDGLCAHETLEPAITGVAGDLTVGETGSLSMTVTNPTTTLSMTGCTLTVTDDTGSVLMASSHRVELGELLPGRSLEVDVPMAVQADAAITRHTLRIELNYQVLDEDAQWTETFTVPVTQAIRLEPGGVQMPTAIAGELTTMTLPLMNMGKGELRNVLVTLRMDEAVPEQSVLVGTMAAGDTRQAQLTFTPLSDAVGEHGGTVVLSCEDAYGNSFSQTLEVNLKVDAPLPEQTVQEEESSSVSPGTVALIVLCVLLAAALAAQGAILTGKLHKLEEERL